MATEKFTVDGSQVVEKIKELIHQGNIRRVRLIHKGRPLIDIPLTAGVGVAAVTVLGCSGTGCAGSNCRTSHRMHSRGRESRRYLGREEQKTIES